VEFRGESTTVWENRERVTLNGETYGLNFHPVTAGDTGEYHCLVNNRPFPESINKLVVQGTDITLANLSLCFPPRNTWLPKYNPTSLPSPGLRLNGSVGSGRESNREAGVMHL
jgi:hypothetical protein